MITKEQILEKMPKPSDALESMLHGLIEWESTPKHKIDMGTFGEERLSGTCFGCAATATVFKHWKALPVDHTMRDRENPDLDNFESIMDCVRTSWFTEFCEFYEVTDPNALLIFKQYHNTFILRSKTWHESLPDVLSLIKRLREVGH